MNPYTKEINWRCVPAAPITRALAGGVGRLNAPRFRCAKDCGRWPWWSWTSHPHSSPRALREDGSPAPAPTTPLPNLCIFDIDNTLSRGMSNSTKEDCTESCNKPEQAGQSCDCSGTDVLGACPAVYGSAAWAGCKALNYNVGIATAEGANKAAGNCKWLQEQIGATNAPCKGAAWTGEKSKFQADPCGTATSEYKCEKMPTLPGGGYCSWNKHYKTCKSPPDSDGSIKKPMVENIMTKFGMDPSKGSADLKKVILFDDDAKNQKMASKMGIQVGYASTKCDGKFCKYGCGITKTNYDTGIARLPSTY